LNRCHIPAFRRQALQGLELVIAQVADRLKVLEEILRGGRSKHGNDPHLLLTAPVDLSQPRSLNRVILNREKPLRPKQSGGIVLRQHPDFMEGREALQAPANRECHIVAVQRFAVRQGLQRPRMRDLNLAA